VGVGSIPPSSSCSFDLESGHVTTRAKNHTTVFRRTLSASVSTRVTTLTVAVSFVRPMLLQCRDLL
jgi:hypothetical protein